MSWEKRPLGQLCNVIPGYAFKSRDLGEQGIPVIKIGSITESGTVDVANSQRLPENLVSSQHDKYRLERGDIVLAMTGEGKKGRIYDDEPSLLNQRVCKLEPKEIEADFLWVAVRSIQYERIFLQLAQGAAQANISGKQIEAIPIAYPPRPVRGKIVEIVVAYDDLIENNRRRIALLEEAARLLYREWFVHLRFPGHEHVPVVDGVPEGWERRKIGEVCDTVGGGTPSTRVDEYWNGEITWVVPSDITKNDCLVLLDSERKITDKGLRKSSAKMVPPETILMTSRASVGFFGVIDKPVCTNQGFINVIPNDEGYRMYFLFNLMSRVDEIRKNAKGTTYPEISKGRFRAMDIVLPPRLLVAEFDVVARNIIRQVRILKQASVQLAQARDLLLPRLMNGEIAV